MHLVESSLCFRVSYSSKNDQFKENCAIIGSAIVAILLIGSLLAFVACQQGHDLNPLNSISSNSRLIYSALAFSGILALLDACLVATLMHAYKKRMYTPDEMVMMNVQEFVSKHNVSTQLSEKQYLKCQVEYLSSEVYLLIAKDERGLTVRAFKKEAFRDNYILRELADYADSGILVERDSKLGMNAIEGFALSEEEMHEIVFSDYLRENPVGEKLGAGQYLVDSYSFEETKYSVVIVKQTDSSPAIPYVFREESTCQLFIRSSLSQYEDSGQLLPCSVPHEWVQSAVEEGFIPENDEEYNFGSTRVDENRRVYALFTKKDRYYFKTEEARNQKLAEFPNLINKEEIKLAVQAPVNLHRILFVTKESEVKGRTFYYVIYQVGKNVIVDYFKTTEDRETAIVALKQRLSPQDMEEMGIAHTLQEKKVGEDLDESTYLIGRMVDDNRKVTLLIIKDKKAVYRFAFYDQEAVSPFLKKHWRNFKDSGSTFLLDLRKKIEKQETVSPKASESISTSGTNEKEKKDRNIQVEDQTRLEKVLYETSELQDNEQTVFVLSYQVGSKAYREMFASENERMSTIEQLKKRLPPGDAEKKGIKEVAKSERLPEKLSKDTFLLDEIVIDEKPYTYVAVNENGILYTYAFEEKEAAVSFLKKHFSGCSDSEQCLESSLPREALESMSKVKAASAFEILPRTVSTPQGDRYALITFSERYFFKSQEARENKRLQNFAAHLDGDKIEEALKQNLPRDLAEGAYTTKEILIGSTPLFALFRNNQNKLEIFYTSNANELQNYKETYIDQNEINEASENYIRKLLLDKVFENNRDYWIAQIKLQEREYFFLFYRDNTIAEKSIEAKKRASFQLICKVFSTFEERREFLMKFEGRNMQDVLQTGFYPKGLTATILEDCLKEEERVTAQQFTLSGEFFVMQKEPKNVPGYQKVQLVLINEQKVFSWKVLAPNVEAAELLPDYSDCQNRIAILKDFSELAIKSAMAQDKENTQGKYFLKLIIGEDAVFLTTYQNTTYYHQHLDMKYSSEEELEKQGYKDAGTIWLSLPDFTTEESEYFESFSRSQISDFQLKQYQFVKYEALVYLPIYCLAFQEDDKEPKLKFFKTEEARDDFASQLNGYDEVSLA